MNLRHSYVPFFFAVSLAAQNVAIYPADYVNVADGPFNSPNLPLANGTGRGQIVYEQWDLPVPAGHDIVSLGFRQDTGITTMDAGRSLQLEIRMGYTSFNSGNLGTNLDTNFDGTPVTVFGPALYQLPNLRDTVNPLANDRFFVTLTTPFAWNPSATQNLLIEYRVYGNSAGGSSFNYRLDRADYWSPVVNGAAGCQHSGGGPPVLTLSPVRTGSQFYATVNAAPSNSFAVLLLAIGSQLVTPFNLQSYVPGIAPACQGQIPVLGAATMSTFTSSTGYATFYFNVPNQRVPYNDLFVGSQAAFFDLFSPGGLVVSNGAQVQIGIQPQSTIVWGAGPPSTVTTGSSNPRYCPVALFGWQ